MAGPWSLLLGLVVVALAVIAVARRLDVRLVLFVAALVLGGLAGDLGPVIRTFLVTLSSEQFIVPICSAMGFAQVLRLSGCDQHLGEAGVTLHRLRPEPPHADRTADHRRSRQRVARR